MSMFVDPQRWKSDAEYREACDHAMLQTLLAASDRAERTFGELKATLQAHDIPTEIIHTGGGVYCLEITLELVKGERLNWAGWRMLVGEPDYHDVGNVTWEASIEDEEGVLDAITLTLNQLPGESVESVADQLAKVAVRMGAEVRRRPE